MYKSHCYWLFPLSLSILMFTADGNHLLDKPCYRKRLGKTRVNCNFQLNLFMNSVTFARNQIQQLIIRYVCLLDETDRQTSCIFNFKFYFFSWHFNQSLSLLTFYFSIVSAEHDCSNTLTLIVIDSNYYYVAFLKGMWRIWFGMSPGMSPNQGSRTR